MSLEVRLTAEAVAELHEAARWYEDRRPGLGREFVDAFEAAAQRIVEWPNAGTPMMSGSGGPDSGTCWDLESARNQLRGGKPPESVRVRW